jgi:transcriptional regulator of nitric oxide reductase
LDLRSYHSQIKVAPAARASIRRSRAPLTVLLTLIAGALVTARQPADMAARFKRVFPAATAFSSKFDAPPYFEAYVTEPGTGRRVLAGVVFWTTDLEPLERGYSGPIRILVGMDTSGVLTGIEVVSHREPYGPTSIDLPGYSAQFTGKSIRDPFRLGGDIAAVSGASVTTASATRAVRNSARRLARQLLTPRQER